jgi:hypothetical protein
MILEFRSKILDFIKYEKAVIVMIAAFFANNN